MVDLKFVDLPGAWRHMTLPLAALDESNFESGLGFDGSSIRGFQEIHESDMLLIPDATTAFIDPLHAHYAVAGLLDRRPGDRRAVRPRSGSWPRRPRSTWSSGIADVAYFGPEARVLRLDHLAYEQRRHRLLRDRFQEGFWNTGEVGTAGPNLVYKLRQKEGYFPVPPADSLANLRGEMVMTMKSLGIKCEFPTTRCPRVGKARSTCASSRCSGWPTR